MHNIGLRTAFDAIKLGHGLPLAFVASPSRIWCLASWPISPEEEEDVLYLQRRLHCASNMPSPCQLRTAGAEELHREGAQAENLEFLWDEFQAANCGRMLNGTLSSSLASIFSHVVTANGLGLSLPEPFWVKAAIAKLAFFYLLSPHHLHGLMMPFRSPRG